MLFPFLVAYQTSKAGLDRFSVGLYNELKPSGIRVTNVRCGMMIDEMKAPNWDPQIAMRFAQANAAIGRNLREQPLSHVGSWTAAFLSEEHTSELQSLMRSSYAVSCLTK